MNDCRRLFVAALLLVPVWPAQVRGQTDDPVPASEVIGVLVQFLAGDFGDLEFVGDLRLQNLSQNPCSVTIRFGEGAGQLPSVPLLADGVPIDDGVLSKFVLATGESILQITAAEPDQLFRGSVLAHSSDHGCAGIVSLQGGYQIQSSSAPAQSTGKGIVEIASIRPGSLLTEGKCVSGPLSRQSMGGVAFVGGLPFTRLRPVGGPPGLRVCVFGDLGQLVSFCVDESLQGGEFRAFTEEEIFNLQDTSTFGNRRLQICLQNSDPGESVYVQLGEFQTDRTGNVQTAQPTTDRTLPCLSSRTTLCLNQNQFQVNANWNTNTQGGTGVARPLNGSTGAFDFSSDESPDFDAIVQVIDACEQAGHFWVSVASTSTVRFTITVTDLAADQTQEYTNSLGNEFQPALDTQTFSNCP